MFVQTLIILALLITDVLPCSIKIKDDKSPDGLWDETEFTRELSPSDCACGTGSNEEKKDKPWNLYVHSKISPTTLKTCTATIIASNLIVTSHKCLTLEGKEMNVYDMWRPKGGSRNMVDTKDVIVTNKVDENDPTGKQYKIQEIIFNTRYAYNSALERFSVNDVLIIVLEENLFASNAHVSICVPQYSEDLHVLKHSANYYGVGKKGSADPLLEIRNELIIHDGGADGCDEENDGDQKNDAAVHKTLCVSYLSNAPSVEGGPLIVYSNADRSLPYLVGIATKVGVSKENSNIEFYAYFSSIIASIKYLEYHAKRQKSKWCTTPELKLKDASQMDDDSRPWENLRSIERDESLNCVCGERNTKQGGRIVGGVEANPYEFGWMAVLVFTFPGGNGASLCGGSVINDRMILTAAHCVINDHQVKRANSKTREFLIPPKNIEVSLYAHKRSGDANAVTKTVAAVLFHPGYVAPRRQEYFDYDIALLILEQPIVFSGEHNQGINPICLPKLGVHFPIKGKNATAAGWGLTNPTDRYSTAKVLQKVGLPIAELSLCSIAKTRLTERFICAGTLNMYKDAASGDSGGPLMIPNEKEQFIEVGIVSWGEDVKLPGGGVKTAALYTDVQEVLSYIDYHAHRVQAKWCKPRPPD